MKKVFNEIEIENAFTIPLNTREVYVLRLILHGLSIFEVIEFLSIELDQYFHSINNIKLKLGLSSWYKVIIKSFELGIIKQEDFVDDIVKQQALIFSQHINTNLLENKNCINDIKQDVLAFQNECDIKLKQDNKENYSITEKEYLELKFKGLDNDFLEKKLKLKKGETDLFKETLFLKLKVNDWYNSFKKSFQLEIINKQDYLTINIELESENTASNIITVYSIVRLNEKEKQLMTYHELIRFYTNLEFNYLSKALI